MELPSQTVTVGGAPGCRTGGGCAVGRDRVVEVRSGADAEFPLAATVTLPAMDNGVVRVTLGTRGQITSLIDHTDGDRQWVGTGSALNDIGTRG